MALSADKGRNINYSGVESVHSVPVAASTLIYQGSAVGNSSGYGRKLVAGDQFLGFAAHNRADNSSGAAGAIDVEVVAEGVLSGVSITGITTQALAALNRDVYMSDDDTFTSVIGSNSWVGRIIKFYPDTSKCDVAFKSVNLRQAT